MDIPATIRKIKTELRLAMNGVASAYMRENGMNYKLNFGVELPRLRAIAAEFPADHDLAQALWKEDIRECKLLAAMLQPTGTFYPEIADIWWNLCPMRKSHSIPCRTSSAPALRLAESVRMDSLGRRNVPAMRLPDSGTPIHAGLRPNERSADEFLDQARTALHASLPVRRAAVSALQKYRHWTKRHERPGKRFSGKPGI